MDMSKSSSHYLQFAHMTSGCTLKGKNLSSQRQRILSCESVIPSQWNCEDYPYHFIPCLMFAQDHNPISDHWKFLIFSKFIGVDWSLIYEDHFWPGLGLPRPKAIVVIPQNQPLPKHLRKKTSKSAKHACHYATKERPVKITMYLGLDIIIKIKFTTIFDRCAILNVLNYLTKNFES